MEKSWIVVVISIAAFVSVNSLQCYTCYNCPASELNDNHLVTCGSTATTTTTGAPVDPGTNNTEPGNNTTIPGTNSTESGSGSTSPGTNGTEAGGGTNSSSVLDASEFQLLRLRRDVQPEMKCICYGIECDCDEEAAVLKTSLYADVTYVCAKGTYTEPNGTAVIIRGCAEATVCTSAAEANVTGCTTCTTDKCNGAYKTQDPTVALLVVLALMFVTKN